MIEAILFDLDDTLVVEEASVEAAFLATCERVRKKHGVEPETLHQTVRREAREVWQAAPTITYCRTIGISSWEGLWARFLGDDPNLKTLREWAPAYRREAWSRALAEHGITDVPLADELAEAFQDERRARHIPFPDTEPILEELRGSYRLGLITNGVSDLQREKVQGANLAHYFDSITVSGEVGAGKPDPVMFTQALDSLAARPETALMVGNSLRRDIAAAQRVGLTAVWINRSGTRCGEEVRPDAQIASLFELPATIKTIMEKEDG